METIDNNLQESRIPKKIKGGKLYAFNKRIFDFFSSLIVILLISWLLVILFIIQLFATKFHPIFTDKRIGKNRCFRLYDCFNSKNSCKSSDRAKYG